MKIVTFHGSAGAVFLAHHIVLRALQRGLRVAAVTEGSETELARLQKKAGLPVFVRKDEDDLSNHELVVTRSEPEQPIPCSDAHVCVISDTWSYERACEIADAVPGVIIWATFFYDKPIKVPSYIKGDIFVAPETPWSRALAYSLRRTVLVWSDDEILNSRGGRAFMNAIDATVDRLVPESGKKQEDGQQENRQQEGRQQEGRQQEGRQEARQLTAPIGGIIASVTRQALPQGWLVCNGDHIAIDTYELLFEAIGYDYDHDPPSGKFRLPDLEGQFLRGKAGTRKFGQEEKSRTKMPKNSFSTNYGGSHSHRISTPTTKGQDVKSPRVLDAKMNDSKWALGVEVSREPSHSHQVVGGDHETRPVNMPVNWIIRAY